MVIGILFCGFLLAVFGVYFIAPKTPKPPKNAMSLQAMEEYFGQVVAAKRPPGLSVAVVKDGEIVYANGFGIINGVSMDPASSDTVYHWWSMTKIPTAIAVMQLHERSVIDIDDPINKYLPFFKVTYKGVEQKEITIRQILNHSAGLPDAIPELITWLHMKEIQPLTKLNW